MFILAYLILALPLAILFPTKVINKNNFPKKQKMIITSNHFSNADTLIYDLKFHKKFRFMAKIELFKNKLFGWLLKCLGAFPVDRQNVSPSVYKKTIKLIHDEKPVFIFPEGTRNKSGNEDMLDVKAGIITFASRGEAIIVPMVMYHPPKLFRKNYIIVGEPFNVQGANPKRLTKDEININLIKYEEVMKELRKELDDIVSKKYKK